MQVDDRGRYALGGQLLADGLDRRRAVGHHEHVEVHAAVRPTGGGVGTDVGDAVT